jgi:diaminopimelate decarboxylase
MDVAQLIDEHGSPLWLVNLDIVRDRYRAFDATWRAAWPDVQVAYSYKANRVPALLRALAAKGAGHQVGTEAEYALARSVAEADGAAIVVQGPAKRDSLLERAGADGALVVLDSAAELRRAHAAGVKRIGVRVSLPGVGHGTSHFGVPATDVPAIARKAGALGLRVEALAMHLVSAGFDRPMGEVSRLAGALVVKWPQPPERFAAAARMLAQLAVRIGVPVVDVGGGFPPAVQEGQYARAVAAAIGTAGFEGRILVEPGRAVVADAVDLACRVAAVKRQPDRTRCVILDAGTDLVPGALFAWPRIEAVGADGPSAGPALVCGPLCTNVDLLHTAAELPKVEVGDPVVIRGVGAYQQTQSTRFGEPPPAVVVRDDGQWKPASRRETIEDVLASDLGAPVAR